MPPPYRKNRDVARTPCTFFRKGLCSNKNCPFLHVRVGEKFGPGPVSGPGTGKPATDTGANLLCTMLKLVFEKQQQRVYNAETGVLNLTMFKEIPDLTDVAGSINFNTQAFCQALCSTIKSLIVPPPSALQLKGNNIASVSTLAVQLERADLHLALRAISLEANLIKSVESLHDLRRFTNLQEIVLRGNPIADRNDYRASIKKLVPSLVGLDGESVFVPPLFLPWPQFSPGGYSDAQKHVLQFIQCGLLNPLEAYGTPGVAHGVDAVSDIYAVNAVLTISLSSPEAAVCTPMRPTNGGAGMAHPPRNFVRDIVSLRLKQTESNHNLLHGVKSTVVACGRTKVCTQMEHWLYPKAFRVHHYLHSSAGAVFLDNTYLSGPSPTAMKIPVTIVTLHGTMAWNSVHATDGRAAVGPMTIRRNFTRVLSVTQGEAGRWLITNDMVSLYLAPGGASVSGKSEGVLEPDQLSEWRILLDPRTDRHRAEVLSRKKNVPVEVIMALCQHVSNDAELCTVLDDIRGVPLAAFEHCANLAGENIMESIQMCRLVNLFGVTPQNALEALRRSNGDWAQTVAALTAAASVSPAPQ